MTLGKYLSFVLLQKTKICFEKKKNCPFSLIAVCSSSHRQLFKPILLSFWLLKPCLFLVRLTFPLGRALLKPELYVSKHPVRVFWGFWCWAIWGISFPHHRRKISSCHYISATDQVITASGLGAKSRYLRCVMVFAQPEDREEESWSNNSQSPMDICQILLCSMQGESLLYAYPPAASVSESPSQHQLTPGGSKASPPWIGDAPVWIEVAPVWTEVAPVWTLVSFVWLTSLNRGLICLNRGLTYMNRKLTCLNRRVTCLNQTFICLKWSLIWLDGGHLIYPHYKQQATAHDCLWRWLPVQVRDTLWLSVCSRVPCEVTLKAAPGWESVLAFISPILFCHLLTPSSWELPSFQNHTAAHSMELDLSVVCFDITESSLLWNDYDKNHRNDALCSL